MATFSITRFNQVLSELIISLNFLLIISYHSHFSLLFISSLGSSHRISLSKNSPLSLSRNLFTRREKIVLVKPSDLFSKYLIIQFKVLGKRESYVVS
ncbi:hypothetical protein L6452_02856 [Arctium lappa]|uniref:Uncharacterized protein n=1 Tax=Arctium lappa TaxID=4217 RepID=A0ACB9FK90_ARCLA|nr:hypothetical protein L6452_02856 [Arctium lappa]